MKVGDSVTVTMPVEGFLNRTGRIFAVFPSGRCQVEIGPITVLNLHPSEFVLTDEIFDRQVSEGCGEKESIAAGDGATDHSADRI